MVSSIAIPSIIGVIMAVVTSKGIFNKLMKIANIVNGNKFGINISKVVRKLFIKNQRHKKATKKAAKKDLNWVCKMKLFSCAKTTAKPTKKSSSIKLMSTLFITTSWSALRKYKICFRRNGINFK